MMPSTAIPTIPLRKYCHHTKWLPLVFIVYFFFNNLLLPHGLLYTTLLTPFFYLWMLKTGRQLIVTKFLLVAIPIALFQLLVNTDINIFYFARSFLLYLLLFLTVYSFVNVCKYVHSAKMERCFKLLIRYNFMFSLIAVVVRMTPYSDLLWTGDWDVSHRLHLFTYEPSYYSTLMAPLLVFAVCRFIFRIGNRYISDLLMVLFPTFLALSFGVISSLILAFGLTGLMKGRELFSKPWGILLLFISVAIGAIIVSTENALSSRLFAIISGHDGSGAVRFFQSNYVAWQIGEKTSFIFGSGFGQAKELAIEFFDEFWLGLNVNRLTNVVAGTFAEFGLLGIILRFGLELLLFFRTKVYRSHFRLVLFWFAFIYQFTGSFTTNLAEYVIWTLAFIPVFYEFERRKRMPILVNTATNTQGQYNLVEPAR